MRKGQEVPSGLSRLERRLAAWRKDRRRGERIPQSLWNAAAKLAADYGVSQTATVLKLDYYALKKRVENAGRDASISGAQSTFVEFPALPVGQTSECVIELEDGMGASLRMRLKGAEVPDVLALGRNFWSGH